MVAPRGAQLPAEIILGHGANPYRGEGSASIAPHAGACRARSPGHGTDRQKGKSDGTTMGRFRRNPLTPKTSGGYRMPQSHGRTGGPGQGQLPWIAYSLRDIHAARAGQSRHALFRRYCRYPQGWKRHSRARWPCVRADCPDDPCRNQVLRPVKACPVLLPLRRQV